MIFDDDVDDLAMICHEIFWDMIWIQIVGIRYTGDVSTIYII